MTQLNPVGSVREPEREEVENKKRELEQLQQELADRELDLSSARRSFHLFEAQYQQKVGSKYAELDRLKAWVLEMATRIHPESKEFKAQAEAAREHADERTEHWKTADEEASSPPPEPTEELKKMFREAAKQIHPDLTTDSEDRDRRHQLMSRLNQAYELGDLDQIRNILENWEVANDWEQLSTGKQLSRLLKQVGQARHRLNQIQAELDQLKQSEMFRLMEYVEKSEAQGEDILSAMVADADEKITTLRNRVKNLAMDCSLL